MTHTRKLSIHTTETLARAFASTALLLSVQYKNLRGTNAAPHGKVRNNNRKRYKNVVNPGYMKIRYRTGSTHLHLTHKNNTVDGTNASKFAFKLQVMSIVATDAMLERRRRLMVMLLVVHCQLSCWVSVEAALPRPSAQHST